VALFPFVCEKRLKDGSSTYVMKQTDFSLAKCLLNKYVVWRLWSLMIKVFFMFSNFFILQREATTLVPEWHVKCYWDGLLDGKRGFWLVSLVPPSQLEWHSNDWSLDERQGYFYFTYSKVEPFDAQYNRHNRFRRYLIDCYGRSALMRGGHNRFRRYLSDCYGRSASMRAGNCV
jgi:hypothetical protein